MEGAHRWPMWMTFSKKKKKKSFGTIVTGLESPEARDSAGTNRL
jgi:hypothetical protein